MEIYMKRLDSNSLFHASFVVPKIRGSTHKKNI
uniref:Uncharacterized protein n=1 Tax=Ciona intestinalis TaxID=7719 RepID=H2XXV7_CIOIN